MLVKVRKLVTHFIVMCNNQAYFPAAKCVTYIEVGDTSVEVALEVEGGNIVTCI